jgi:AraC-like DNA-binding protein
MYQYLEAHGISPAAAAKECGIQIGVPPKPDERVTGSAVERLWAFSVRETKDPLVGLHMAGTYNPGTLDILGYVVLSCSRVGEVLDRLSRYVRVLNDGMRVDVILEPRVAYCRCSFVESMDNYLLRRPREAVDTIWGGLARELGRLTAKPLTATEVWFRQGKPAAKEVAAYERTFEAPVKFGMPEDRFIVPRGHLDEPVRSANPALLQIFEKHADQVLGQVESHGKPSRRVLEVVAARMKGTVPTLTEVARDLAMSDRNLQRALRGEGTSFQKLVDELRRDLAISHLANPDTSAGQVGFLLGFSEPSTFHRAFRRWTGKAPHAFRKSSQGERKMSAESREVSAGVVLDYDGGSGGYRYR